MGEERRSEPGDADRPEKVGDEEVPAEGEGGARTRRMGRISDEEGQLSYGTYLRVPELLSLQTPVADPAAHDELLFITVHQAFELWFKEMAFELESARDRMIEGETYAPRHYLERVHAIARILIEQIGVLETMSPQDFLEFRSNLSPASGFQSLGFREIEFISGLRNRSYLNLAETGEERARLEGRLREPSLWDGFRAAMDRHGLPMPAGDEEARRASLIKLFRDRDAFGELFALSEALLTYDELFSQWRYHHILMVEREIGSKTGTGGSSGASYLRTTLDKRFFPELWDLRSYL
ncbi:MAG TPA: tryptophan 2,3-dioxygenase family protein [Actinomycetota bacterium]|jgi:tryptophan 2,3-dioxygenase|nr:tryptophan 2,3-dioxygenase family protein [Actinomycetota bacterium]